MSQPPSVADQRPPRRLTPFLITRQHRLFLEFADAVRRHRYIGACYGAPGIGKTLSARTYAAADDFERWNAQPFTRTGALPETLMACRTVLYTPAVTTTTRELELAIDRRCAFLNDDIEDALHPERKPGLTPRPPPHVQLLIIDEADRLKTTGWNNYATTSTATTSASSSSACPASNAAWPATPSSTAASASPTTTGPWTPKTSPASSPNIGSTSE